MTDVIRYKKSDHCSSNDRIYYEKEKDRIYDRLFFHFKGDFFIELLIFAKELADQTINRGAWIMHCKSLIGIFMMLPRPNVWRSPVNRKSSLSQNCSCHSWHIYRVPSFYTGEIR